jgi:predicted nucleotidyltransferase component of viral defense system
VSKADQAKSIAAKLSKLSKAQKIPYENFATAFLIERLLARLISSPQLTKSLVFKGGYVGLRVYNSTRYTMDLDAVLLKSDVKSTLKQAAKIIESDINDGTWFSLEEEIDLKAQGEYGGIRQIYRAGIGEPPKDLKRAQIINFDLGIGDPITPAPVRAEIQEMIGDDSLSWQIYPVETIVAEILQTLIERGSENSRAKDVFDLYYYLPKADVKNLKDAIEKCFEYRGTEVPKDPSRFLAEIDRTLLKRGWNNALATLKSPPTFERAFDGIMDELKRIYPARREKK